MVSLLNPEQKQIVLNFNTTPDNELSDLWLQVRKSTTSFPAEWLMPTKYDSLSNYLFRYWTTEAEPVDYIDYLKDLESEDLRTLWINTDKYKKRRVKKILRRRKESYQFHDYSEFKLYQRVVYMSVDAYRIISEWKAYKKSKKKRANEIVRTAVIDKRSREFVEVVRELPLDERRSFWKKSKFERKKEVKNYLRRRRKYYEIDAYNEYELYVNFVKGYWNNNGYKKDWIKYQTRRVKKLAQK